MSNQLINFISYDDLDMIMHEKEFPSLRIGSRLIVPKEKFRAWVEEKTGGSI